MILICAATTTEAKACLAGLALAKNGHSFGVLQTGMGRAAARRSLQNYLKENAKPNLVISTGFAGSLNENAQVGSWVCGVSLRHGFSPSEVACTVLPPSVRAVMADNCAFGRVRAVDLVVTEHIDETHNADEAVDMESYGLFEVCRAHEIGFSILRLISDTPSDPLPAAIKTFSSMFLSAQPSAKGRAFFQGASQLMRSPKSFALFAIKASRLREDLTQGWLKIADSWPMRPKAHQEEN